MKADIFNKILKSPVLIPALTASIGSVLGFISGIMIPSIEGGKAIELEQKKFEFSIIQKVINESNTREDASNELRFLVDIGVIETLSRRRVGNINPENIPSFRESNRYDISLSEPWGNLHEAVAVWDLNSAIEELESLKSSGFRDCIRRFASDAQKELVDFGNSGFDQIPLIKKYYNTEALCRLPMGGYYPPRKIVTTAPAAGAMAQNVPLPDIDEIPPYRQSSGRR